MSTELMKKLLAYYAFLHYLVRRLPLYVPEAGRKHFEHFVISASNEELLILMAMFLSSVLIRFDLFNTLTAFATES